MGMTDPIADLLTRIRNASAVHHDKVFVPASNMKLRIVHLLKEEGYVRNFKIIEDNKQDVICIYLKYAEDKTPAITELNRVSSPGRRTYVKSKDIPSVRNGLGIAIISTIQSRCTRHQALILLLDGQSSRLVRWR